MSFATTTAYATPIKPGQAQLCNAEQSAEFSRDAAIRSVMAAIELKRQDIEHGAFVVLDNGNYIGLPSVPRTKNNVPVNPLLATLANAQYNLDQVVGFVHSHPLETTPGLSAYIRDLNDRQNRAPSDNDFEFINNPSVTVASLRFFLDAQGVDYQKWLSSFSHYIITPTADLAEFDSDTRRSGPNIVKYGITYRNTPYYRTETDPVTGSPAVAISKEWHSWTKSDAASKC